MMISLKNVRKLYGANTILDDVSFLIGEGEKTAFVGVNGAGKTTLFKIISGEILPDGGTISVQKSATVSYLEQNAGFESDLTIYEEMMKAFSGVIAAEEKLRLLEKQMGGLRGIEYERVLAEYNETLHYFEQNNGYEYKSLARGVIAGLGLEGNKKISKLSGGQKTRAALARALLSKPGALLLDEPTNHLDIQAMGWLEGYLKSYTKTILFISHDRYFIDSVASRVIEIENGRAFSYSGGYSYYIRRKGENFDAAEKQYKDKGREIERLRESARLLRSYNRQKTVKRAESIEKRLAKEEPPERPRNAQKISFSLEPKIESGKDVLSVIGVSKRYGSLRLFENVSFEIKKNEKAALIGGNGIGKTTLLKLITGGLQPDTGVIRIGANVKTGYYDQERHNLNMSKTVIEHVHDTYPKLSEGEIRNVLGAFLFRGDDVLKPVAALSGGERGRVCLAEIMLSGANFLILDEPTNDLDMLSKEILENALTDFKGTLLCVSHDRYFINKVAGRVLELSANGLTGYLGNFDYYLRKKAEDEYYLSEKEDEDDRSSPKARSSETRPSKSGWLERKAEIAEERRRRNHLLRIEGEIEETERRIKECDELMCSPDVFSDHILAKEAHDKKLELEEELERLYDEWEKAHDG